MADIDKLRTVTGSTYTIRDNRVPVLPESENVYLCGDGTWQIPFDQAPSNGVIFVDGGDHLKIIKSN